MGARKWRGGAAAVFAGALVVATFATAKPAELSVDGFGWLRDREMKRALELLLDEGDRPEWFDASHIEDAALVMNSELVEEGFFEARVLATWTDTAGRTGSAEIDATLSKPLPRPLAATRARLEARPGRRAVVQEVGIEGLTVLARGDAEAFFKPSTGLFTPDRVRAWSPARTRRAADRLREALWARGYAEARAELDEPRLDRATGEVRLLVRVEEGPLWRVRDWRAEVKGGGEWLGGRPAGLDGEVWSRGLARELAQETRSLYYGKGYADARVEWAAEPGEVGADGERAVSAVARVEPGEAWRIGAVRTEGAKRTRTDLIDARLRLAPGAPLNPEEIDAARRRLARLGVFRRVDVETMDGAGTGTRDLVFKLVEDAPWSGAWSVGYGSYEQLRGGVELGRGNLWGLAHRDRVELGQSIKSSRGEYRYTVPTLFDDAVEGSARIFGLRREEPSFTRLEYGSGLELARELSWIEARGAAGLSYEVLRADDVELGFLGDEVTETEVTALTLGLTQDRRDNPIRPRGGSRWSLRSETALPELGGDLRYQRVQAEFAWHHALGEDRWVHLGLSHGLVAGGGEEVPVNKLFFPGGESSIRGYGEGEASPRDAAGRFVGARCVWLVNVELEQVITGRWTAVVFCDTLGTSTDYEDWPGREVLSSAGLGLRYQSPIGPLRIEYGRNLNPREGDPSGTLHFSIGFPF